MSSVSQRAEAITKAIPIVIAAVQRQGQGLAFDLNDATVAGAQLGDAVVALAKKLEAYVGGS
jgi:hypothetical protein